MFRFYRQQCVRIPVCSQLDSLNICINRTVHKIFGVRNAESINDVRRFVELEDVAELVENRRSKFIDRIIVSGKHVDLCIAAMLHLLSRTQKMPARCKIKFCNVQESTKKLSCSFNPLCVFEKVNLVWPVHVCCINCTQRYQTKHCHRCR